jgi:hypothetical protein
MQLQTNPNQIPEQFASVSGLGAPLGVYSTGSVNRWISAVLGLILLIAAALVALYGVYDTFVQVSKYGPVMFSKTIFFPLIIAAGLFLVGILTALNAYRNWQKAVVAYDKGLAYYDNRGLQIWGWSEVERFYAAITKHYHNGIYTGTSFLYTLQKADGATLKLDNKIQKIETLGQLVGQKTAPFQYEKLVQALRSGAVVQLGPIGLSRESFLLNKKAYAWEEVEQIGLRQGYLNVKKKNGGWFSGASAPVAAIPNLNPLLAVVEQITKIKTG